MTTSSPWLLTEGPGRPDGVTLFCLPYAGGGASIYRSWRQGLPDHVQLCRVQLPGRETRFAEPPLTRMEALLDGLADALVPWLDRPFALFGHSMGGVVAAALTRRLDRTLGVRPRHLFISGSRPPHLPVAIPLHGLPPNDFLAALRRDGGTPGEVLDCPELMDVFTPVLRADHAILETWGTRSRFPLPVPVTCFAGTAEHGGSA